MESILQKLFTKKTKKKTNRKLSMADQDYIADKNEEINTNKVMMPVAGGIMGAGLGSSFGVLASKGRKGAVIAGGLAGAGLGAYGMHKLNKKVIEPQTLKEIDRYKSANKEDRAYLRQKRQRELDRRQMEEMRQEIRRQHELDRKMPKNIYILG